MSNSTFFDLEHPDKEERGKEGKRMKNTKKRPGKQVLQNLFNYSKALKVNKSVHVGFIENIMN